jgi:hypothetical protein
MFSHSLAASGVDLLPTKGQPISPAVLRTNERAAPYDPAPFSREFANIRMILPHAAMEPAPKGLAKLVNAARRPENLPYTLLACLAFLSLSARLILILK